MVLSLVSTKGLPTPTAVYACSKCPSITPLSHAELHHTCLAYCSTVCPLSHMLTNHNHWEATHEYYKNISKVHEGTKRCNNVKRCTYEATVRECKYASHFRFTLAKKLSLQTFSSFECGSGIGPVVYGIWQYVVTYVLYVVTYILYMVMYYCACCWCWC